MLKTIAAIGLLLILRDGLAQQSPSTFDAASIKPNKSASGSSSWNSRPGYLLMRNQTLIACMAIAYQLKADQITGGPKWVDSDRFDIEARAVGPAKDPELFVMLQALLADRFQLKFHRDGRKPRSGYGLVVGKNGLKIRPVDAGPQRSNSSGGRLLAERVSMDKLAETLAIILRAPVSNVTNTSGVFSFELEWSPEATRLSTSPEAGETPTGPSLFSVLQDHLGLKLEARKESVELLVIDQAERPSEN